MRELMHLSLVIDDAQLPRGVPNFPGMTIWVEDRDRAVGKLNGRLIRLNVERAYWRADRFEGWDKVRDVTIRDKQTEMVITGSTMTHAAQLFADAILVIEGDTDG